MADLQSVVDHHSTIPDEAIRDAAKSIRVAQAASDSVSTTPSVRSGEGGGDGDEVCLPMR
ncbi:MAG: hypothetical protein CM15mP38_0020 [Synechococcus sp.]|nr:MAG: hypothetical protein CM15mP38_0020 [Synechococcus sp.]